MAVYVACPHCRSTLRLKENFARRKARCPHCKHVIDVASPADETVNIEVQDAARPLVERARALGIEVGAETSVRELSRLLDAAENGRRPPAADVSEEFK